ncbi:MAG: CDP-glucose 4,6-dehydratase [Rhodobacterales bacterium]|nr:CDP-glucose 4,6-dehydratase [Rhodobacterales bacterium]
MTDPRSLDDWAAAFRGRRVLVTGDTGFKGSWLALWLSELGAEVTGFALPPEAPGSHFERLGLAGRIAHRDGDLRDLSAVRAAVAAAQPHFIFHLAAQALVRRSYADPKETFDTNVGGGVNLLEAVREGAGDDLRALVFITSDKAYRNREWTWGYRENDELGGRDPYSASKAAAELVFRSYAESFLAGRPGFGLATTRAGNVIGGGDWAEDRIVPDCMRALTAGRPIVLRNPEATRPWQHVLEPLSGYLRLAVALERDPAAFGGAWNFGPDAGNTCTVGTLAQGIVDAWGSGRVEVDRPANAPHEFTLLHLNTDRATLELGWRPRWNLARTIAASADWYNRVTGGEPALDVSRAQIAAHMEAKP